MEKKSEKGRPVFGLGALEARILGVIYDADKDGITVREVYEKLLEERKIAYTTVMTVMHNLMKKQLLSVDPSNIAFVYKVTEQRGELLQAMLDDLEKTLYSGNKKTFKAALKA